MNFRSQNQNKETVLHNHRLPNAEQNGVYTLGPKADSNTSKRRISRGLSISSTTFLQSRKHKRAARRMYTEVNKQQVAPGVEVKVGGSMFHGKGSIRFH